MAIVMDNRTEWLEPDGLGGFASGTTCGERTRRYHALLLVASSPPTGRMTLVNGFDAWVDTPSGTFAISTQRYTPNVVYPDGVSRLVEFNADPWPRWTYRNDDQTTIVQELFVPHGLAACCLRWTLTASIACPTGSKQDHLKSGARPGPFSLAVRPLFSGRDYHCLHHENSAFGFKAAARNGWLIWHPYDGVPGICLLTNASYLHQPDWYRSFLYEQEQARGLDCVEDLASPGILKWDLSDDAVLILAAEGADAVVNSLGHAATDVFQTLATIERKRRLEFPTALHRAADAYLVRRSSTGDRVASQSTIALRQSDMPASPCKTIIAGYPWFTDWGRDTFVSVRGLCLTTGRIDDALQILLAWAGTVSEGMLPNRFPDSGSEPEYNSVDASLWFTIAVHDLIQTAGHHRRPIGDGARRVLEQAVRAILDGYARGTRFGIRLDDDFLMAAGQRGVQLTWMDAKVGDWVVTPRIGKPVEVQALWLNALQSAITIWHDRKWIEPFQRGSLEFERRFWNPATNCLYDVVDVDHVAGQTDALLRPNQIFSVGGLPFPLLHGERARHVVAAVEHQLLTPLGLRTLAPGSPNYAARYAGDQRQRDNAYHQGTVWPWLLGPFVEAWLRVRGESEAAKAEGREKFLPALEAHLQTAGLGHISEIADAESPFTPGGCPFQAWSLGELLRLKMKLLAE
ncbi:MAG: glycogen debranching enzyme family protein [Pirellulales bacterium]|nr:glycogen debranching enzyme family protein [Pirellulales bacterium]